MDVADYVFEAAAALRAPVEVWVFHNNFNYDWSCQEWGFEGPASKGPKTLAEMGGMGGADLWLVAVQVPHRARIMIPGAG